MSRPKGPSLKDRALVAKTVAKVRLPIETIGKCVIARCRAVGHLADGLCIKHWDMGLNVQTI